MKAMEHVSPSATRCYRVVFELCGQFVPGTQPAPTPEVQTTNEVTEDSPHTQMNNLYAIMWPNVATGEADATGGDAWMNFLRGEVMDDFEVVDGSHGV